MLMKERYTGEFPEQFPYRSKAMFVFEEIDGVDVCFFGMHVQEYGSDCQAPNTRSVGGSLWVCFQSEQSRVGSLYDMMQLQKVHTKLAVEV